MPTDSRVTTEPAMQPPMQEDMSEYVAHLQLHMTLQAKNLVPSLTQGGDSRQTLLQETQANFEKYVSRQSATRQP